MVKINGVAQMVVVMTQNELFRGMPIRRFGGPAYVLQFVTLRFSPALFALIRP